MTDIKKEYPEHDKLAAVSDESNTIGQFLEGMQEKGITLAHYPKRCKSFDKYDSTCSFLGEEISLDICENCDEFRKSGETILTELRGSINDILADYFSIDQKKLEQEKKEMLQEFQELTGRE